MKIRYLPFLLNPPSCVYEPAEDTYLLIKSIKTKDINNKIVLEVGGGNGLVTYNLSLHAEKVYVNDIDACSLKHLTSLTFIRDNVYLFKGKGVTSVNLHKINVIICNPPYLPPEEREIKIRKKDIEDEKGCNALVKEIAHSLLQNYSPVIFYFVASSLCPTTPHLKSMFEKNGFKCKILKKERYFFEEIYVYRATI